jgi:hypothetical protein
MPIEIRELVIRATVDPATAGGGGPGSCGMPQGKDGKDKGDAPAGDGDSTSSGGDLVQACVREVMRILERKEER